ncbi:MAG: MBL fold metallo-hydrolase [Pseudomonadota bacterium]|nr:MBL fold metallo-hydrolase [Pseudomonadota bacterium]
MRKFSRMIFVVIFFLMSVLALGQELKVTLLGSGEYAPQPGRLGPSVLVEAGDQAYVFDAGRGVLQRFAEAAGFDTDISAVFFTHLHSDHVMGFPGLWLATWGFSRRAQPLQVFGPTGTQNMLEHLRQAFAFDIDIRIFEGALESGVGFNVTELEDGFVWQDGDVSVRAFEVDHSPVKPAFGYRIDWSNRSVALSGDTKYSEALIEATKGVDLLIHEVSDASEEFIARNPRFKNVVMGHHTTATEAGRVFSQVKPKLAVYAHMVTRDLSFDELIQKTKTTYSGPIVVGEDLMTFRVGDEVAVVINRPSEIRH